MRAATVCCLDFSGIGCTFGNKLKILYLWCAVVNDDEVYGDVFVVLCDFGKKIQWVGR